MKKHLFFFTASVIIVSFTSNASAQQYKLRQSSGMMGMNTESTIYVKGMRKRTESAGMMGMSVPTTIEQCDLQRTIKINDKKKLYYIEPFAKEEVMEDAMTQASVKTNPVTPTKTKTDPQTGGSIHMWYNITDTGERKQMNGFTARHVWTSQKIKPSPDACTMKDSFIIKTDGWYIDLPEFNCPIRYTPTTTANPTGKQQPDCKDKYITHRSGKGKLGFPLTETKTIIMGNSGAKTTEFVTSLETLEFSSIKLDPQLFEIPPDYTQTMNEADLQDKVDMNAMINQYKNQADNNNNPTPTEQKKTGGIRIGVYEPTGDGQLQASVLQQHLVTTLTGGSIEAIAVATEEDAKKYNCDYTLTTGFTKVKQNSKAGGLIKVIKNADPNAATSFTIDANMTLRALVDGATRSQQNVSGKYDGKADEAAKKALDEGSGKILSGLN